MARAQAPATPTQAPAAAHAAPQRGTVQTVEGNNITIKTDAGQQVVIAVSGATRLQRLSPGSTDLKTAGTASLSDVAIGDRLLVSGTPGDSPSAFNASRVILMKSSDIAQRHEAEQQDWQRRGIGGLVSAVDTGSGVLTVTSGTRKLQVSTTSSTAFRRYADGSVRFEDAKPGTLAQIHVGDQVLARGAKSDDGTSVQAEEVVSGSFRNLSGTITSIDAAKNAVSLKDLATKREVTVLLTTNSSLHRLPPEAAASLSARAKATSSAGTNAPSAGGPPTGSAPANPSAEGGGTGRPAGMHRSGGDLSQIVSRLPPVTLTDLHAGDVVMVVAEQSSTNASGLTAITLLAGVESILAASPSGSAAMTLSPWGIGGGAPEGGSQ